MQSAFIKVQFDLKCHWDGFGPEYRIFVNDELFVERVFRVKSPNYYIEMLQVISTPGRYRIRLEIISQFENDLTISNTRIEYGSGIVHSNTEFEIL